MFRFRKRRKNQQTKTLKEILNSSQKSQLLGDLYYDMYYSNESRFGKTSEAKSKPRTIPPIQLMIENTTDETKNVVLFGTNKNLLHPNFGADKGVKVTPTQGNVSYFEVLMAIKSDPITVNLFRVQSANSSQVMEAITISHKEPNGRQVTVPIITQSYFSAMQMQSGVVDVPFVMNIDGNTELLLEIRPKTTSVITFFYELKSDLDKKALIDQLESIGITPDFIHSFMKKEERKMIRKARIATLKKQLVYIFSFKWIFPNKDGGSEDKNSEKFGQKVKFTSEYRTKDSLNKKPKDNTPSTPSKSIWERAGEIKNVSPAEKNEREPEDRQADKKDRGNEE